MSQPCTIIVPVSPDDLLPGKSLITPKGRIYLDGGYSATIQAEPLSVILTSESDRLDLQSEISYKPRRLIEIMDQITHTRGTIPISKLVGKAPQKICTLNDIAGF